MTNTSFENLIVSKLGFGDCRVEEIYTKDTDGSTSAAGIARVNCTVTGIPFLEIIRDGEFTVQYIMPEETTSVYDTGRDLLVDAGKVKTVIELRIEKPASIAAKRPVGFKAVRGIIESSIYTVYEDHIWHDSRHPVHIEKDNDGNECLEAYIDEEHGSYVCLTAGAIEAGKWFLEATEDGKLYIRFYAVCGDKPLWSGRVVSEKVSIDESKLAAIIECTE